MENPLHIPNPCYENWSNMQPDGNGRHCEACSKTVVDFTAWETEEIIRYLKSSSASVCGRLRTCQLQSSEPTAEMIIDRIEKSRLSFMQKVAAAIILFIAFNLSACMSEIEQIPDKQNPAPEEAIEMPAVDTVYSSEIMGLMIPEEIINGEVRFIKPNKIVKGKIKITRPAETMGDVEVSPIDRIAIDRATEEALTTEPNFIDTTKSTEEQ